MASFSLMGEGGRWQQMCRKWRGKGVYKILFNEMDGQDFILLKEVNPRATISPPLPTHACILLARKKCHDGAAHGVKNLIMVWLH